MHCLHTPVMHAALSSLLVPQHLPWPADYVSSALARGELSRADIITYLQGHAPREWLATRRLLGPVSALSKTRDYVSVAAAYRDYASIGSADEAVGLSPTDSHAPSALVGL